jgi:phytoene dehydrogenase-like protein
MNRRTNDCEITVLGSGLGGLVAATLLVRKKRRVLLLREKGYGSSCIRGKYRFSPFSSFSERRLRPSLLRRVSKELDLPSLGESIEGNSPVKRDPGKTRERVPFQVILPDARIDLFDDLTLLKAEWKREFPCELSQIEGLYDGWARVQALLKGGGNGEGDSFFPLKKRSLIRKWFPSLSVREETKDEKLSALSMRFNEFVRLQLVSWGNLFSDAFPASLSAYLLLHEKRGEWVAGIDLCRLEEKIVDHFLKSGGEIDEIEKAEGVSKRWREGFILTLERDRRVFQSQFFILNGPLHNVAGLFKRAGNPCLRWLPRIHPRYVLFPSFFGIREKVVPIGMRDLLVSMRAAGKPYEDGNILLLDLSPRGDEGSAPEGRRALTVQSLVSLESLQGWNQAAFTYRQQSVMNHLNHLFPFLEQFLEFADFDWANEQIRRWSYPYFLYETRNGFDWREGVVPVELSGGLYFTGKENFPYLGVEGEILGGLMAAEQILQKA